MLRRGASQALTQTATSSKQLTNYGGRVLAHAKVYVVQWGATGGFFPEVTNGGAANFFGGITNSAYFDWLREYNTSTQTIGRGSYAGTYVISPSAGNNGNTIDDAANIEPELQAQIAAHNLPAPDANTIYFLYFRQSQVVDLSGSNSVTGFSAYHNTIANSPTNILYAVMPYENDPGCGTDPVAWNNMTVTASHELIETVTDPDVGLATSLAPPLTWYNNSYGEIGDICNGVPARVVGGDSNTYAVQQEWSNTERTCLATRVQTISAGDVTMAEGNTRTARNMKFAITLSDPSTSTVTVQYQLVGVTATGAKSYASGVDFNNRGGALGTLTFSTGTTGLTPVVKYVSVPVYGDTNPEPDETFNLVLSSATPPYTIARAQATGTILNDDNTSGLLLAAGDASISAGDVHSRMIAIPITLSSPAATPISMHFTTTGTGTGFKAAGGTITFAAGSVAKTVFITIYPDSAPPPGESFTLTLSAVNGNGTAVQLWRPAGTGTILGNT